MYGSKFRFIITLYDAKIHNANEFDCVFVVLFTTTGKIIGIKGRVNALKRQCYKSHLIYNNALIVNAVRK